MNLRSSHALTVVWGAVGVLAIVSPLLLIHLPIYPDETQWKATGSRLFLDNLSLTYLFPECSSGFVLPVPISWWPSRVLDAFIYGDASNPNSLRVWGIATYFCIWAAVGWIIAKLWPTIPVWLAIAVALALTSFGSLTPLLVLNRPEQGILVPFLGIVGVYLHNRGRSEPNGDLRSWLYSLLLVLLVWMMLAAHIKSFVLLPVAGLAALVTIRRWLPMFGFFVLSAFSFYENYRLWAARTDCPQSPHLESVFSALSLSPKLLLTDPVRFAGRSVRDLWDARSYIGHGLASTDYQSAWWPSTTSISALDLVSNTALIGVCILIVAGGVFSGWRYLRGTSGRLPTADGAMVFWLGAAIVILATYQTTKNFYETSLVWPILILVGLFVLKDWEDRLRPWRAVAVPIFVGLAMVSQIALISRTLPHLAEWDSIAASKQSMRQQIVDLAVGCQLKTGPEQTGMVVDDVAYSVFWRTPRPVINGYFYGWWASDVDQASVVRTLGLKAEVAACTSIPEEYRSGALRSADESYCCVHFRS